MAVYITYMAGIVKIAASCFHDIKLQIKKDISFHAYQILNMYRASNRNPTLKGPLQNVNYIPFELFRGGFTVLLWITASHNPVVTELHLTD